jgi:hypothetical protein
MRLYNATNSLQRIPLNPGQGGTQKLEVSSNAVSVSFIPSPEFISLVVSTFSPEQMALIVSGPFEISMCAKMPVTASYIVQSIDEAIQRFAKPAAKVEEPKVIEEPKVEEVPESKVEEAAESETLEESEPKKKTVKRRASKKK